MGIPTLETNNYSITLTMKGALETNRLIKLNYFKVAIAT